MKKGFEDLSKKYPPPPQGKGKGKTNKQAVLPFKAISGARIGGTVIQNGKRYKVLKRGKKGWIVEER